MMSLLIWPSIILENFLADIKVMLQHFLLVSSLEVR